MHFLLLLLLRLLYVGIVLLMQGCLLPPFQAKLDTSLGKESLEAIKMKKTCEYRITLDQPSAQYTVTKYQDNYVGDKQQYTFPLGATLSSYLSQAQNGDKGKLITLNFSTSNFHFILGESFIAAVNSVRYEAHFIGAKPIGSISFPTSFVFTPAQAEEIDFPKMTFYAVSEALRLTTIKLFDEVSARVCYR